MRDGSGHFRLLVLVGALAMVGSGFLPWWQAGGDAVAGVRVPAAEGIGLSGAGIVIYVAAITALVLLDLGHIRGRWGFFLDAPAAYLGIGLVACAALLYRGWELWSVGYIPVPASSPGFAAAAVGVVFVLYGAGTGWGRVARY